MPQWAGKMDSAENLEQNNSSNYRKTHSRTRVLLILGLLLLVALLAGIVVFLAVTRAVIYHQCESKNGYDWPPPSDSVMDKFRRAAITSDHGLCSEVGRNIMIKGGNAVDATIASLFCLGVTNPHNAGLGGGFIMTVYNKTTKSCKVIDARETAPKASSRDMFGTDENASKVGHLAVATPGELAGYWLAFNQFGSKNVNWSELLAPAIDLARNGAPVSENLGKVLRVKEAKMRNTTSMRHWYSNSTGRVYEFGDIIKQENLADTLERLANADDPVELFYKGDMADVIVREIKENGGIITREDLANYQPKLYDSLENKDFHGNLIMCGPGPPSSFASTQSIVAVMLSKFGNLPPSETAALKNDPYFYHWIIEVQKFAYAQRTQLGDGDFVPEAMELSANMTTKEFIQRIVDRVPKTAMPPGYYTDDPKYQKEDHGTVHVSAVDPEGNGVSATSTINRWFGAVVQSEALGIVWNDQMDDFSSPNITNGFGFQPSPLNFIEPGKRPMSSMSPIVIYDANTGNPKMVIGASGGAKIITAVAKTIVRVLLFNETIKEAIDMPNFYNQFSSETIYELEMPEKLSKDLKDHYNQKSRKLDPNNDDNGVVQGVHIADDGFIYANGDYRRRRTNMHPGGF